MEYGEDFFSDPQAIANEMIFEHSPPNAKKYKVLRNLIRFGNTSELIHKYTPVLGEQTREVLEEAGYSQSEIDDLYDKEVVLTA